MKKILFFLLFVLMVPFFIEANYLKITGGLTSSKHEFSGYNTDSKLALTGGVGIETGLNRSRFCAEVFFSYEDVSLELDGFFAEYRFIKLSMPLLYKFKIKNGQSSPYLSAGGAGSIIFADDYSIKGKTHSMFDISLIFAVGMEIDLIDKKRFQEENYKWNTITIEGRYQMGLKNLELDGREFKNSSLYILFGFKF